MIQQPKTRGHVVIKVITEWKLIYYLSNVLVEVKVDYGTYYDGLKHRLLATLQISIPIYRDFFIKTVSVRTNF